MKPEEWEEVLDEVEAQIVRDLSNIKPEHIKKRGRN